MWLEWRIDVQSGTTCMLLKFYMWLEWRIDVQCCRYVYIPLILHVIRITYCVQSGRYTYLPLILHVIRIAYWRPKWLIHVCPFNSSWTTVKKNQLVDYCRGQWPNINPKPVERIYTVMLLARSCCYEFYFVSNFRKIIQFLFSKVTQLWNIESQKPGIALSALRCRHRVVGITLSALRCRHCVVGFALSALRCGHCLY